jgi:uroporphyrinogen decarboxylase
LAGTGADILGVDHHVPLGHVRSMAPKSIGLQGNLDPIILTTTPEIAVAETKRVLEEMRGRPGHIFNLGHGVTPDAKIENIESLVQTVRSFG